jgi:hypothetical protein
MGHEKRKGKEVVVEKPVRKRTRAEKEAERAELVAKAAEDQASGRARSFRIREQLSRGRAELAGPPEPPQSRQREIRLRGSRQLSQRSRVLPLHDGLATLGSRQREVLRQRPSVAQDRGLEAATCHRSLAGPQQQQQLAE